MSIYTTPFRKPITEDCDFQEFTTKERTLRCGLVVKNSGTEAPWLNAFGACLVKVWDMKRDEDGTVLFGIGNEKRPPDDEIGWVTKNDFYSEWPD